VAIAIATNGGAAIEVGGGEGNGVVQELAVGTLRIEAAANSPYRQQQCIITLCTAREPRPS
jgi:hypothetical protein